VVQVGKRGSTGSIASIIPRTRIVVTRDFGVVVVMMVMMIHGRRYGAGDAEDADAKELNKNDIVVAFLNNSDRNDKK